MEHNTKTTCKGCEGRHVGCHSTCECYKEQREKNLKEKDFLFQAHRAERELDDYVIARRTKMKKKK